jgi:hypothetical protein
MRHQLAVQAMIGHEVAKVIAKAITRPGEAHLVDRPEHRARIALDMHDARLRKERPDRTDPKEVRRHLVGHEARLAPEATQHLAIACLDLRTLALETGDRRPV